MGNEILQLNDYNMTMIYRLAMGNITVGSKEGSMISSIVPQITDYYDTKSAGDHLGWVDEITYSLYKRHGKEESEYNEVALLLARRKVLDYSHGQAPLSPESHLKKLKEVLKLNPTEVLLVGDDDLLSVSLARRGIRVSIIEIDPYTCALIHHIKLVEALPINIEQVDLRDPLPKRYRNKFDLFVADPDFTIESFALFLSRGLARLRVGGTGLINFEKTISKSYQAKFLMSRLNVEIMEDTNDSWRYTVLENQRVPIRGYRYGKYTVIDYEKDLVITEATFSSKLFKVRRTANTEIPLPAEQQMSGPQTSIYDY